VRSEGTFTEALIDLRKLGATRRISGEMAARLRFSAEPGIDFYADDMLLELSTQVWTEDLPPEHFETTRTFTVTAPASWWQHFKEAYAGTWWLGWLVRRRPPVTSTARRTDVTLSVDLRRFRAYPAAPEMTCRLGPAVLHHGIDHQVTWRDR
jgi:hypothetical protein